MRRMLNLFLLAGFLLPGAAQAQERVTTAFLDAGPSVPVGDSYDLYGTGFVIGGGFETPWTRSFDVRGELGYNRFGLDEEEALARSGIPPGADVELDGGEASVLTALVALKYRVSASRDAPVRPYLLAGLGYWRRVRGDLTVRTPTETETLQSESQNGVAGALGAGVDVRLREATVLFVEGRYVVGWDFGDPPDLDDSHLPLRLGVAFDL